MNQTLRDEEELALRQMVKYSKYSTVGTEWTCVGEGIGPLSVYYDVRKNEFSLLIYGEDNGTFLLNQKILQDTVYKKDHGRYILWKLNEYVYSLNFRSNDYCHVIWEHLCEIQGKQPYTDADNEGAAGTAIKQEVKEEPGEKNTTEVSHESLYEEMLDIENIALRGPEKDILEQLIDMAQRMVSTDQEDKTPTPAERKLLYLFHIPEDVEVTDRLQKLHKTILSLLSENNKEQK